MIVTGLEILLNHAIFSYEYKHLKDRKTSEGWPLPLGQHYVLHSTIQWEHILPSSKLMLYIHSQHQS